jgi:hypothetical protein
VEQITKERTLDVLSLLGEGVEDDGDQGVLWK